MKIIDMRFDSNLIQSWIGKNLISISVMRSSSPIV